MDLIGGPRALDGEAATALRLGPLLRHVGERDATIWLETTGACTVTVRADAVVATDRTFQVAGHHYAIVVVTGLEPASSVAYSIELDGDPVWPLAGLALSAEPDPDARPGRAGPASCSARAASPRTSTAIRRTTRTS